MKNTSNKHKQLMKQKKNTQRDFTNDGLELSLVKKNIQLISICI